MGTRSDRHIPGWRIAALAALLLSSLAPLSGVHAMADLPVTLTVTVLPPYSPYLSDYFSSSGRVLVQLRSLPAAPRLQIRLEGRVDGDNGVQVATSSSYRPALPLVLEPGAILSLSGNDLREYFNTGNLSFRGTDAQTVARSGMLPEGNYTLCLRALDFNDGRPLSADQPLGCGSFSIADIEPPALMTPNADAVIPARTPQSLSISWTRPIGPAGVSFSYRLQMVEILVAGRGAEEAFRTSRTPYLFDRALTGQAFTYGPSDPALVPGRRYALRIVARDVSGRFPVRNNGASEAVAFTWGDTASSSGGTGGAAGAASGWISAVYPANADTIPFSFWPFIIRIDDMRTSDTSFHSVVAISESSTPVDRHERRLTWPQGPVETQRRLTFPELTEEQARHIAVYKNSTESPREHLRGAAWTWTVDVDITEQSRRTRRGSSTSSTVVRGMPRPGLLFPGDEASVDTGSLTLQFSTGNAPRSLLPPYPVVQASRSGVFFFNGSIRERWRLDVSRSATFDRITDSTSGLLTPNFDMLSPLLTHDQIARELYRSLEHRITVRDTGWYYWRVSWMKNPEAAADTARYHASPVRRFRVVREMIVRRDIPDTTTPSECLANCTAPAVSDRAAVSTGISAGSELSIGLFTLTVTEMNWSGTLLSGRGTIRVPFLRAPVKVAFRGLQVNAARRIFAGEVLAERDNTTLIDSSLAYGLGRMAGLDSARARSINQYASQAGRLVSGLAATTPIGMPIGLDNIIDGQRYTIAIVGLRFTPEQATLAAVFSLDFPELNGWLSFGARDICFHPGGMGELRQATLFQVVDQSIADPANKIRLTFLAERLPADSGTYVSWDCKGFREVRVKGHVSFTREWLIPENQRGESIDTGRVKATFETRIQRKGDWIARLDFDRFRVPDLDGFGMEVVEAFLDFSDLQNPPGIVFPPDYPGERSIRWRGFFLRRLGVTLPSQIHTVGDPDRRIQLAATNMIIDNMGFTGNIRAENVLRFTDGAVGGWSFSIDTVGISFAANTFRSGGFSGLIGVPVCDSGLAYSALLRNTAEAGVSFTFSVNPRDTVRASLWAARLVLDRTSSVNLVISRDSTQLSATFSGQLTIAGNIGSVPGLSMRGLSFQRLRVFTREPYVDLGHIAFASEQHGMAGFPISLTGFNFVTRSGPRVGLQFGIGVQLQEGSGGISGGTQLSILGRLDTRGGQVWTFDGISLDSIGLGGQVGVVTIRGGIRIYDGDPVYGDGFKGTVFAAFPPGVSITATVQFGSVRGFQYWYVDGLATLGPSGIPVFSGISIFGFGGGAYHHMRMETPPPEQSALLAPGDSTRPRPSGIRYVPDINTAFGLRAAVVMGTSDGGQAFNATIALEASFSSSGGMSMIALRGDGCMMCDFTDRSGAQVRGRVDIVYDFGRSILDGRADIWVNVAGGVVRGIGPEGLAGWAHVHSEPAYWFFKIGEPDRRVGVRFGSLFETTAYIMVGERLPPPPPPPARVLSRLPEYRPVRVGSEVPGDGFAMGASMYLNTGRIPFLIFYGRLAMELGFDVALIDYGASRCDGMAPGSRIGIDGWYATGQVYGWIQGDIGLFVDLLFFSGEVQILEVSVAAILQAGLPNPTWMKGAVAGEYSVLGGAVSGRCYFEFTVGDICRPPVESPLARQKLITDLSPVDGSRNVDVFVTPQAAFGVEVNRRFDLTVPSDDGSVRVRTFRAMVESFSIRKGATVLSSRFEINRDQFTAGLIASEALESRTAYTVRVVVRGEEMIAGRWQPAVRLDGSHITEERSATFTTGDAPDSIPQRNILVSYPRYRQRFFLQDECRLGIISLRQGQAYLFERPVVGGMQWKFFARFIPREGSGEVETPVTYDRTGAAVRFDIPTLSSATTYAIQIVARQIEVASGPRLPQDLQQVLTQPTGVAATLSRTMSIQTVLRRGETTVNVRQTVLAGTAVRPGDKLLHVYHMRTSTFNRLSDKVRALNAGAATESRFLDVILLKPTFTGQELFDVWDLRGGDDPRIAPPLVRFSAPFEDRWHRAFPNPQIYELLDLLRRERLSAMQFRRNRPDPLGIPPIHTVEVAATSSIPGQLREHELVISTGGSPQPLSRATALTPSPVGGPLMGVTAISLPPPSLNLSYTTDLAVRLDYGQLRNEGSRIASVYGLVGSEFLSRTTAQRLQDLVYGRYQPPSRGQYTVGFTYMKPVHCQDPDESRREVSRRQFTY